MRLSIRKKGSGSISRGRNGRIIAKGPRVDGVSPVIGRDFATEREAQRAIDAFIAAQAKS